MEVKDPLVFADTALCFGSEHQHGTELVGYLFHLNGPLIMDGYEVPDDKALHMNGTYLWERQRDVSTEFYEHTIRAGLQVQPDESYRAGEITIDGDASCSPAH